MHNSHKSTARAALQNNSKYYSTFTKHPHNDYQNTGRSKSACFLRLMWHVDFVGFITNMFRVQGTNYTIQNFCLTSPRRGVEIPSKEVCSRPIAQESYPCVCLYIGILATWWQKGEHKELDKDISSHPLVSANTATSMVSKIVVSIDSQVMAWRIFSTKPLPELMLTYCQLESED